MKDSVAIVIPAYNPNEELYNLIKELEENEYTNIIVINDGSQENGIFKNIKRKAKVIDHKQNRGKGQALKTGFTYCLREFKNIIGVITVDADGQHRIADINKLYEEFTNNKESLILGSRCFRKRDVPIKSRIGNIAISKILNKKTGYKIQDTQTGLRAIPIRRY